MVDSSSLNSDVGRHLTFDNQTLYLLSLRCEKIPYPVPIRHVDNDVNQSLKKLKTRADPLGPTR